MAIYEAKVTISYTGRIEANSESEAEQLAMSEWADDHSAPLVYEGVEDVEVDEVRFCDGCGEELFHGCKCEDD